MPGTNTITTRACPLADIGVGRGVNPRDRKLFQRRPDCIKPKCDLPAFTCESRWYVSQTTVAHGVHSRNRAVTLIQCPYGTRTCRQKSGILAYGNAGKNAVCSGTYFGEHTVLG